jgi:hypothetical protein
LSSLISVFQIVGDQPGSERNKGQIIPCGPVSDSAFPERLKQNQNYRGFSYEENHLEEWIAREPAALFGSQPILLLASQNYLHLPSKIDLLFIDAQCTLYPVELKVKPIAKNGGEVPYDLYQRQMKPYVNFLTSLEHLGDLDRKYLRFSALFNGHTTQLAGDFALKFGQPSSDKFSDRVEEVYVAEDFDSYAVEYFERESKKDGRRVHLIKYNFFPKTNQIEFWSLYHS